MYPRNNNRGHQGWNNRRPQQGANSQFQQSSSSGLTTNDEKEVPEGSKFDVEVNYLDLCLDPQVKCAYKYDVAISPDKPRKFIRPAFDKFCSTDLADIPIAFDGKATCFSMERLSSVLMKKRTVTVTPEIGRPMEFSVSLKEASDFMVDLTALERYRNGSVSEKPLRALECLEVVISQSCYGKGVQSGLSFYFQPGRPQDLGSGYELWYGLSQSVVLGERLLLNIDVSYKAFAKPKSVLEIFEESRQNYNTLISILKNADIIYTPPVCFHLTSRLFKMDCLGNTANTEYIRKDDKEISIKEYYYSKCYDIKFPNYKLLKTRTGVCYPMELCKLATGKSNENFSSQPVTQIVKHASVTTQERKAKAMELFRHFHATRSPIIKRFGITFGDEFIKLEASRLFAPKLTYLETNITPLKGRWNIPNDLKFLEPAAPETSPIKWAMVNLDKNTNQMIIDNFKKELISLASEKGMSLDSQTENYNLGPKSIGDIFGEIKSNGSRFAFIILGDDRVCSFANVKQQAELKFGLITQCIKSITIKRSNPAIVNNIVLQLNSKLNGVSHKVDSDSNPQVVSNKYVMFVGADVTHPSPQKGFVAVVSSSDSSGCKYNNHLSYQEAKTEIIVDMKNIMVDHLTLYKNSNEGNLPSHIFYYRDGLSDYHYEQVKEHELIKGMESAFAEISRGRAEKYKPSITCIIVLKTTHTRLFPLENETFGRKMNVFPGTVVDKVICNPKMKEFFIVSHESGIGTAEPTKYVVLRDDASVDLADIEKLTYNLCHVYPRCPKAVSYPAPAYLAQVAAARGKVYIEGETNKS